MAPRGIVPEGSPFEDLFRDFNERNPNRRGPRNTSALGSGFVVSEDGYVVTNNHVIEGADEILVEFPDLSEYSAKVVGIDKNIDIALLKIETDEPLPFVKFGDSDLARVGDWVMAIGNPLGQGFLYPRGLSQRVTVRFPEAMMTTYRLMPRLTVETPAVLFSIWMGRSSA